MARVNHKIVKQRLNEKKSSISDREFFSSRILAGHFEDIAEVQTRRYSYNRRVRVNMLWNPLEKDFIAATNNRLIIINAGHELVTRVIGREKRYNIVCGLFAHELGHVLYTDFPSGQSYVLALAKYRWYPTQPEFIRADDLRREKDFWEYVKSEPRNFEIVQHLAHYISNVLEDGYIENRMLNRFPGMLGYGLEVLREEQFNNMPTVTKLIKQEKSDGRHIFESILQIILQYAKFGEIKYSDEPRSDERIKVVFGLLNVIDDALRMRSGKSRWHAVNLIMIRCWDYIKDFCEICKAKQKEVEKRYLGTKVSDTIAKILKSVSGSSAIGKGGTSSVYEKESEEVIITISKRVATKSKADEVSEESDNDDADNIGADTVKSDDAEEPENGADEANESGDAQEDGGEDGGTVESDDAQQSDDISSGDKKTEGDEDVGNVDGNESDGADTVKSDDTQLSDDEDGGINESDGESDQEDNNSAMSSEDQEAEGDEDVGYVGDDETVSAGEDTVKSDDYKEPDDGDPDGEPERGDSSSDIAREDEKPDSDEDTDVSDAEETDNVEEIKTDDAEPSDDGDGDVNESDEESDQGDSNADLTSEVEESDSDEDTDMSDAEEPEKGEGDADKSNDAKELNDGESEVGGDIDEADNEETAENDDDALEFDEEAREDGDEGESDSDDEVSDNDIDETEEHDAEKADSDDDTDELDDIEVELPVKLPITGTELSVPEGGTIEEAEYKRENNERSALDIERVLGKMAEKEVFRDLENERVRELNDFAQNISYGNIHSGVNIRIKRIAEVDDDLIDQYAAVSAPLLKISQMLQNSIIKQLEDRRRGGKYTGLLMGRRLDMHAIHRTDGKVFYKTVLPNEVTELSVALLLDESGSMEYEDRSTYARATAIILYDFCQKLRIPIMIYGHSTDNYSDNSSVEIYSYAEPENYDGNDKYRLMDVKARYNNRDGAPLRYVADRLSKRPEEVKILILVSDGQPLDRGYYGTEAEEDLRGIKKEYQKKGILFVAAAIGDDKPDIERIYGDAFMDITDLNQLPVKLSSVIKKHIRV